MQQGAAGSSRPAAQTEVRTRIAVLTPPTIRARVVARISCPPAETEFVSEAARVARESLNGSADAVRRCEALIPEVVRVADALISAFAQGHCLYVCGNGGSAADAQHFVAELVGRFTRERPPYPAFALTTNTSVLTALANDYEFVEVFARQVRAHVRAGDVLVGISTSGRSPNVLRAFAAAPPGAVRIALFGGDAANDVADIVIRAPGQHTAEIQAGHLALIHAICGVIDAGLA